MAEAPYIWAVDAEKPRSLAFDSIPGPEGLLSTDVRRPIISGGRAIYQATLFEPLLLTWHARPIRCDGPRRRWRRFRPWGRFATASHGHWCAPTRTCAQLLKRAQLLTRDARVKERKKVGLKRARKAPQYTKR